MDRREFMDVSVRTVAFVSLLARAGSALSAASADASTSTSPSTSPIDAKAFKEMRRFANLSVGKIAYVERGKGDVALFLHGYPLNGFQWRGALERLSSHRRCIAPDFMGMGCSEVSAEQDLSPDAQVEMLVSLLDSLHVHAVDLVANDSGGAVAQLLMTRHPDRVRTLLLTNCDTINDSPPPSFLPIIALCKAGQFADKSLAAQLAHPELARSARGIGGLAYTYPASPSDEALEMYFAPLVSSELRKRQVEGYAIALEKNPLADIEPALRASKIPTRILWGSADRIFAQESARWLDSTLGNSKGVRMVDGAKLFFPEEMPDLIAEEARRLWGA